MGKNKFCNKSEAQKMAIRASYAKRKTAKTSYRVDDKGVLHKGEIDNGLVPVNIKTHNDKKGGHPHIIVDNVDDKHVSVGLSTKPTKGKGSKNYRLEKSPLNDGKQSYMRRQGTVAQKNEYSGKRKGAMTTKDYEKAKVYGERAKQKYLDCKKDKKK